MENRSEFIHKGYTVGSDNTWYNSSLTHWFSYLMKFNILG